MSTAARREPKTRAALNGVPLVSAERASRALHRWGAMFPVIRPGTSGWIYFAIRRGVKLKVGWSRDPAKRIATIEESFYLGGEATPLVIVGPCHRKAEYVVLSALHAYRAPRPRFRNYAITFQSEVFSPTREVLELCAMLRASAEASFFDNRLAPYERGPVRHCRFCNAEDHNAQWCRSPAAVAFYRRVAA